MMNVLMYFSTSGKSNIFTLPEAIIRGVTNIQRKSHQLRYR
jgi:hypothetical protein